MAPLVHAEGARAFPVTPEERKKYRAIGSQLAVVIRNGAARPTSTTALQAVVADLVGNETELLLPLKELVGRPAFQRLVPKAGSGSGSAERLALLQELQRTFAPAITLALEELLGGFLDLPGGHSNTSPQQKTPSVGGASATVPPSQDLSKVATSSSRSPMWAVGWIVAAGSSALALGGVLAMRSPAVCSAIGLCESQETASNKDVLASAKRAGEELERSTDLGSYRDAAWIFEQELSKLKDDQLSTDQKAEVEQLELMHQRAKAGIEKEETAQKLLKQAAIASKAAQALTGGEQQREIEKALAAVNAIPNWSFASQEASQLREVLEALQAKATPDPGPTPEAAATAKPEKATRPTPETPQSRTTRQESDGWRKPPLWESPTSPPRTRSSTGHLRDQPLF